MSTEQNMNTTQETGMAQKAGTAQVHTIAPVYNENSRILILGSFPSVKSREQGFLRAPEKPVLEGAGRDHRGSGSCCCGRKEEFPSGTPDRRVGCNCRMYDPGIQRFQHP